MTSPVALETFDTATATPVADGTPPPVPHEAAEAARLAAYEAGYQAGFDDAVKAEADNTAHVSAEFSRNLQDLGFTFHEARAHVIDAVEPFLRAVVEALLPRLMEEALAGRVVEEVLPLAGEAADAPVELLVAPGGGTLLEPMVSAATALPVTIVEEPTLSPGQVYFRLGETERSIDIGGAVDRIVAALDAVNDLNRKALNNG